MTSPEAPEAADLVQAERDFVDATQRQGAAGWASFFHDGGAMITPHGVIEGRRAITEHMEAVLTPGRVLSWRPSIARASLDRSLGFTDGRWRLVEASGGIETELAAGRYISVWSPDASGAWRVLVDMGHQDA